MTTPYGTFTIYGVQSGLPTSGPIGLGPLLVPFSDCAHTILFTFPSDGYDQPFTVPTSPSPSGVAIIPSGSTGDTLTFNNGATVTNPMNISAVNPTIIEFDPNNVPTAFTLVGSAEFTVAIQYL